MHIALLALAFLPAEDAPGDKDAVRSVAPVRAPQCENAETHWAKKAAEPVQPGKLGDQPLANQYLALLRLEGGCDRPIKTRERVGASADRR